MHRDSIGSALEIEPGAVNWMTAGRGVVHSERTPERLRHSDKSLHGLQIWVALPKELEECEPSFTHITKEQIPAWTQNNLKIKLMAGEAFGKKSPVPVHSRLYFIEIINTANTPAKVNLGKELYGESALYILNGSVTDNGQVYNPKHILIAKDTKICAFEMAAHTTVYIFGGEPFPEERYIHWNFVSSSRQRIEQAKHDWINQRFHKVPGETEFVPMPQPKPIER